MEDVMVWLYLVNTVLIVNHEIDSAYWREWRFFPLLPGKGGSEADDRRGLTVFLLLHVPLLAVILWGLIEISRKSTAGLAMSLFLGLCGVAAFSIHMFLLGKGRPEFRTAVSIIILVSTFLLSLVQIVLSLVLLV